MADRQRNASIERAYTTAFIVICGILILLISSMICFYSDDEYYATFLKNGFSHFISMNIEHYKTINGRAMVHILDEIILFFGERLFAVLNPLMIISFAYIASRCENTDENSTGKKNKILMKTAAVLFFIMCLPQEIIKESIYWITGSMNYMFPALLVMTFYYTLKTNSRRGKISLFLYALAFLSGATTEQGGFLAVLVGLLFLLSSSYSDNAIKAKRFLVIPVISAVGYLTVILAPGTMTRISYTKDTGLSFTTFYNMIFQNIPNLSESAAGEGGIGAILALLILAVFLVSHKTRGANRFFLLGPVITALFLYQRIFHDYRIALCIQSATLSAAFLTVWGLSVLKNRRFNDAGIFILCGVLLQVFMLISPVVGSRTFLITGLFLTASLGLLCTQLIENSLYLTIFVSILAVMLLPLEISAVAVVLSFALYSRRQTGRLEFYVVIAILASFLTPIVRGYYENHQIIEENKTNIVRARQTGKLYWDIDMKEPYYHKMFYQNLFFEPYFFENNDLPADTEVYLVSKIHKPIFLEEIRLKCPSIEDGILYLPLRDIFETIGGEVSWNNITNTASVIFNGNEYIFNGQYSVTKKDTAGNTEIIWLEGKIESFLYRTYVPQSFMEMFFDIVRQTDRITLSSKKYI